MEVLDVISMEEFWFLSKDAVRQIAAHGFRREVAASSFCGEVNITSNTYYNN